MSKKLQKLVIITMDIHLRMLLTSLILVTYCYKRRIFLFILKCDISKKCLYKDYLLYCKIKFVYNKLYMIFNLLYLRWSYVCC